MLTMDRHDLGATLDRLHRATDAIGANLLELEADPTYQALELSPLTGTTADRWQGVRGTLADLWRGFSLVTKLAADADASAHDEEVLRRLLTGPSIELARERVPVAQRGLLTAGQSTTSCTPDELLATMADGFRQVQTVVTSVASVWDDLVPRLAQAREQLLATDQAPSSQLDELAQRLLGDPLAVDAREIAAVEAAVAARQEVAARRDELRGRLEAYRAMAFATGLVEDPTSADAYTAAHDALHRAPADLAAAELLLRRYQDLLTPPEIGDQR